MFKIKNYYISQTYHKPNKTRHITAKVLYPAYLQSQTIYLKAKSS
nr:MAG TPA: hypothetical protein [Caudoviricetes sp.]